MSTKRKKSYWKETRKESGNLNQKAGPFETRKRYLIDAIEEEEAFLEILDILAEDNRTEDNSDEYDMDDQDFVDTLEDVPGLEVRSKKDGERSER